MEPRDKEISVLLISGDDTFSLTFLNAISKKEDKVFSAYRVASHHDALGDIRRNTPNIIFLDFQDRDADRAFRIVHGANPDIPIVIIAI
jgi:ActR/RegA family two-component response regulator